MEDVPENLTNMLRNDRMQEYASYLEGSGTLQRRNRAFAQELTFLLSIASVVQEC